MNNSELEQILKQASVQRPREGYWEELPQRVIARIRLYEKRDPIPARTCAGGKWQFRPSSVQLGLGLSFASLIMIGVLLWRAQVSAPADEQTTPMLKYLHEIGALFPNQVKAIVFDQSGAHLELSDAANVPASLPVYLKICSSKQCQRFLTFSGQQIRLDGELCDVLLDRDSNVILAGRHFLWSSATPGSRIGPYRIVGKPLQT